MILDIIAWLASVVLVIMGANAIIATIALGLGRPAVTIIERNGS